MNRVQIIHTPRGERLAVLPAEDYEALLEAASDDISLEEEDALAGEMRRLREAASGMGLPVEEFRRILSGESAVKVWRGYRGLSGPALAERAGVSLQEVETVEKNPREAPIETLAAIARELGISLEELVLQI